MTTTLTPPADAPLPWRLDETRNLMTAMRDRDGNLVRASWELSAYLVACANAAPTLVEERDTALARVAVLEQEVAEWRIKADAARDEVDRLQCEVPALRIKCHHQTEAAAFIRGRLREALDLAERIGIAGHNETARLLEAVDELRLEAGIDVVVPAEHIKETP